MTASTHHNTILVGAGPIGLELAVNLKDKNIDYLHLDAGQVGQTITWYPHNVRFFSSPDRISIAGIPLHTPNQEKASREQYLAYLRSVVAHFDLQINTFERVTKATHDKQSKRFTIKTKSQQSQNTYTCDNLILAIGDMHEPQLLNIPGENLPHVSHYFDEPHKYFRKKLLIVGGRNSAVEAALKCHHAGADLTLSYRRDNFDKSIVKYWLYPEIRSLISENTLPFLPNTTPIAITPTHVTLAPVTWHDSIPRIDKNKDKHIHLPADFVLLLTGYKQNPSLFNQLGVSLQGINQHPHYNAKTMMTNIPNLYVAGTATAGTQSRFLVFIENSHIHTERIISDLTHSKPNPQLLNTVCKRISLPES